MKPSAHKKDDLRFAAIEAANSAKISLEYMSWQGNAELRDYYFKKMEINLGIARIYTDLAATFAPDETSKY